MVCCAGEVGLGAAGVSTGLTAIGAVAGSGAVTGGAIVLAVPALAALVLAGAVRRLQAVPKAWQADNGLLIYVSGTSLDCPPSSFRAATARR
jgi:hypothetical protein